jgi:HEAT repeat protein
MDVFRQPFSGQGAKPVPAPAADPRLQPTPDYGTLGPGSDIAAGGGVPNSGSVRQSVQPKRFGPVFAAVIGVIFALFVGNIGRAQAAWANFASLFSVRQEAPASAKDSRQLDRMKPQKQAEALLELAVGRSDGAVDQISSRVDHWQGKLKWNSQIATLTTAALNSNDMRVRESGVEVELAAYGLAKNSASLEYLLAAVDSKEHARKIWALWALGLMGNRGVESDRVVQVLTAHLNDADEDSRRWAVEGLALTGSGQTIGPLLKTMHDDPSAAVRERAACSLAESGMFAPEQRMSAVPQLLIYSDDPSLDAQTHAWAFHALQDITHQRLPNDSTAWRSWYESSSH